MKEVTGVFKFMARDFVLWNGFVYGWSTALRNIERVFMNNFWEYRARETYI